MKVLVTGAAGFIGFHVCRRLAASQRCDVLGVDSLDDSTPPELKRARLGELDGAERFRFVRSDVADETGFPALFSGFRPDYVVHLAARPGVRSSVQDPESYVRSNLIGFFRLLECCRQTPVKHFVYASSSSIYSPSAEVPFGEGAETSRPLSFYGATKKSNEVMAHAYSHLYGLNSTGLRFFNVYGPWGRPDTVPTLFAQAICRGEPIDLYDAGRYRRDFTYIDDAVDAVLKVLLYPPAQAPTPPYRLFNVGHHRPVDLRLFVQMLERLLERPARLNLLPPLPSELPQTFADIGAIGAAIGFQPRVPLEDGLSRFVAWFRSYYGAPPPAQTSAAAE